MKLSAELRRILLTTIICFLVSILSYGLNLIIFNAIIVLTNLDRIRINKLKAIILSVLLSFPIFFFSMFSTWGLSNLIGEVAFVAMGTISGVLIYLVNSIYIQMRSFKLGLIVTGILAGTSLFVLFVDLPFKLEENAIGMPPKLGLLFITWQTLVSFGISIGVWTEVKNESSSTLAAS